MYTSQHLVTSVEQPPPKKVRMARVARACDQCRRRKQGCTHARPCTRCVDKGLNCVTTPLPAVSRPPKLDSAVKVHHKLEQMPAEPVGFDTLPFSVDLLNPLHTQAVPPVVISEGECITSSEFTLRGGSEPTSMEGSVDNSFFEPVQPLELETNLSGTEDFFMPEVLMPLPLLPLEQVMPALDSNLFAGPFEPHIAFMLPFLESLRIGAPELDWTAELQEHSPFFSVNTGIQRLAMYPEATPIFDFLVKTYASFAQNFSIHHVKSSVHNAISCWRSAFAALQAQDIVKLQQILRDMDDGDYVWSPDAVEPAIVIWSSGGVIQYANDAFCQMTGYRLAELRFEPNVHPKFAKKTAHAIFHPDEMVHILTRQMASVENPASSYYQLNTRLVSRYCQQVPVSCMISNVRKGAGQPLLTVAQFLPQ